MKILVTGANGYIGMRLIPSLFKQSGHEVYCAVRDPERLSVNEALRKQLHLITLDFLHLTEENPLPEKIDVAYYLIHSMSSDIGDFSRMEAQCAHNFVSLVEQTQAKQIIYLSGIVNEKALSKHLASRKNVEDILMQSTTPTTVLRAGIIVGSGSASFEIIRDLCEKLPIMITPKWVKTKSQPIGIRNVMEYLTGVLLHPNCLNQSFDIGGADILTYKEMLHRYAKNRGFRNWIISVPIMTPRLSSYWLHFVTSTSYPLAVSLVDSMNMEVIAKDQRLQKLLKIRLYTYDEAIQMAFRRIAQNSVVSSWKDSMVSGRLNKKLNDYIQVPRFGVLKDAQRLDNIDPESTFTALWKIGGSQGWYYANFLWKIRGYLDQLAGGVGFEEDAPILIKFMLEMLLIFWRVLLADKKKKRLLLFAEMKLPGEAWLEFKIVGNTIFQTATFRPRGLLGKTILV